MKNRYILTICLVLALFSFTACGVDEEIEVVVEDDQPKEKLYRYADEGSFSITNFDKKEKVYRGIHDKHVVYHDKVSGSLSAPISGNSVRKEEKKIDPVERGTVYTYKPVGDRYVATAVNFGEEEKTNEDKVWKEHLGVRWSPDDGYVESVETNDFPNQGYIETVGGDHYGEGYIESLNVRSHGNQGYVENVGENHGNQGYIENVDGNHRNQGYVESFGEGHNNDGYIESLEVRKHQKQGYIENVGGNHKGEGYLEAFGKEHNNNGYIESLEIEGHGKEGYVENFGEGHSNDGYMESLGIEGHTNEGYVENVSGYSVPGYTEYFTSGHGPQGYIEYYGYNPSPGYNERNVWYPGSQGYIQSYGGYYHPSEGYLENFQTANPSTIAEARRLGFY